MAYLLLVRHGESEWNALGKWTGWTDVSLSEKGREEARKAADAIKDIPITVLYSSPLARARQTLDEIVHVLGVQLPVRTSEALKEKNYGDYTGKNKWEVKKEVGDEEFLKIRRSWDYRTPNGESLKDVYDRVVPFYKSDILPLLEKGEDVLITSHGNTMRALVKYLDSIPDDQISSLEIGTGEVYVYDIDSEGKVVHKEIRSSNPNRGKI